MPLSPAIIVSVLARQRQEVNSMIINHDNILDFVGKLLFVNVIYA